MPFKLSPSSLSLMKECPRCFWLTQHKIWKRPEGIFPSLPSGMDKILKIHFDKFRDRGELPPEIKEDVECEGCKLFPNKELLDTWRNNFKGISWTDKEGDVLHGAVDNILVKGKKLIVLDYKTRGYELKEDTAEHYQDQLNIYNFLLRIKGYDTEDFGFLLFYYPKEVLETGEVVFDTKLIKMKIDIKNAENLWKKALKILNDTCPKEGCEWCEKIKHNNS
jgi:hypothetical protein